MDCRSLWASVGTSSMTPANSRWPRTSTSMSSLAMTDADRGPRSSSANTPNLDRLVAEGSAGLVEPVGPGITPGSGPGHLGLFGYDPLEYELGRGALSAAGLDVELKLGDVAARGNLASLDGSGNITDRRAGRIPDDEAAKVVDKLRAGVGIGGVEVVLVPD